MNYKTPLSNIDCVGVETEYAIIKKCIASRLERFGVDPRCEGCPERCKQSLNPVIETRWECFKTPGLLTREYWALRRSTGAGVGASRKPGRAGVAVAPVFSNTSAAAPADMGKEGANDTHTA